MKHPPAVMRYLLSPLAIPYGLIVRCRNLFYDKGWLKTKRFSVPVISVGNITAGGTGKTPFVQYLAARLMKNGYAPGIVSRGYGRESKGTVIVHDGTTTLATAERAGDEPCQLATNLNIPVIVDENRSRGIRKMLDMNRVNVVILDDGFQHRKVHRDVDILLFNAEASASEYRLLPIGNLREPLRGVKRAHLIVHTRVHGNDLPAIGNRIKQYTDAPQLTCTFHHLLMKYDNGDLVRAESSPATPPFAFCGIAAPESFRRSMKSLGISPRQIKIFSDHQKYSPGVLSILREEIRSSGCKSVITTEKDLVKLPPTFVESFPLFVIRIDVSFNAEGNNILKHIIDKVQPDRRFQ